ncbi:MAG: biotin--[acetyl-CoA-carboxylase] ligase [Anaerolineae bacterium]|nr:biotin--[acetyl-CoA-carboxylase] ligase [Anaerolineae bacterium]
MSRDWLPDLGGRPYRYFAQVSSTQDIARAWALEGAANGAIVIADEQTAGRGRLGRTWLAAPGSSLLLSVILRPALPPEELGRVTLLGAVALAEALAGLGVLPGIKWPNDLQLAGRKVAGILAEAVWSGDALRAVVLGIGVNVQRDALPPAALEAYRATTVEAALGRHCPRGALLGDLLAHLDAWMPRLREPILLEAWTRYNVTLGRRVVVAAGHEQFSGVAEALDNRGALLIRLDNGSLRPLLAGEVTIVDEA